MKETLRTIRVLDIFVFIFIIFLTIFSFFYLYATRFDSYNVVVKYADKEWIYPLEKDIEVEIEGKLGITKLKIESKEVSIISSPCPHKTCINSSPLKKAGDWNACLPNQVFIYIKESN